MVPVGENNAEGGTRVTWIFEDGAKSGSMMAAVTLLGYVSWLLIG